MLALLGDVAEAESQLHLATELAGRLGLDLVAGAARANLGYVATLRGDLPGALDEFTPRGVALSRGERRSMLPRLQADHAQALADAALFDDADGLVRTAIESYRRQGQETELAGTLLTSAEIRLAQHDLTGAVEAAPRRRAAVRIARTVELGGRCPRPRAAGTCPRTGWERRDHHGAGDRTRRRRRGIGTARMVCRSDSLSAGCGPVAGGLTCVERRGGSVTAPRGGTGPAVRPHPARPRRRAQRRQGRRSPRGPPGGQQRSGDR